MDIPKTTPKVKGCAEFIMQQDLSTEEMGQLSGVLIAIGFVMGMGATKEKVMETLEEME